MAWLWRGGAEGVGEESVAADHREENAAAMATMRELCKDLLDPDTHGASESAPANARSDDDGEREFVPAAKLEIPEEATLQRFVTGYELDAHVAAKRLRKMLKWRVSHSYGLEDTLVRDISESTPGVQHQIETGKCYILAQRDTKGRPIIVVHVRRHDPNTQTKDELSRFGVHILESAERLLREPAVDTGAGAAELSSGVPGAGGSEEALEPDKLLIIFNLEAVGMSNIDLNAAKRIIYMLSNFYPERMGQCLLVSAPMLFSAAWAVIRPWLSRRTQTKIEFCKPHELGRWMAPTALPRFWGGLDETVYSALDQD